MAGSLVFSFELRCRLHRKLLLQRHPAGEFRVCRELDSSNFENLSAVAAEMPVVLATLCQMFFQQHGSALRDLFDLFISELVDG